MIQAVLRTYSTRQQHQINFFEATVILLPCFDLSQVGRKGMAGGVRGKPPEPGRAFIQASVHDQTSPAVRDRRKDEKIQAF